MTATAAAAPSRVRNYRLVRGEFGAYKTGAVLPEFVLRQAGGEPEEWVRRGKFEPTTDPVPDGTVYAPPKAAAAPDGSKDVYDELNKARAECERLATENARLDQFIKNTTKREAAIKDEVAKYIADNSDLRRAVAQRDADLLAARQEFEQVAAELAAVKRDLDAATAPKGDAKTKQK